MFPEIVFTFPKIVTAFISPDLEFISLHDSRTSISPLEISIILDPI